MDLNKINTKFQDLTVDHLYHLGIDTMSTNLKSMFSDVKYVIFSRFNNDIAILVHEFAKLWYQVNEDNFEFKPIFKTERYHLYKIGPILLISHGIGLQSMLICLNEITKLLVYANVDDAIFLKVGPSGGLAVDVGAIIIGNMVVNHKFEQLMYTIACGKEVQQPTNLDQNLVLDIIQFAKSIDNITLQSGTIINNADYYEGQARLTGFLPLPFSIAERYTYLQKLKEFGVKSIDMESTAFAGFCSQLAIKAGIINVVIVDRWQGDDILIDKDMQHEIFRNTAHFISSYLMDKLS